MTKMTMKMKSVQRLLHLAETAAPGRVQGNLTNPLPSGRMQQPGLTQSQTQVGAKDPMALAQGVKRGEKPTQRGLSKFENQKH